MTLATSRRELERWLATAAFNTYYRFRLREFGECECTIDVPFRDEFKRPGGAISGPVFIAAADFSIWPVVVTRRGDGASGVTRVLTTFGCRRTTLPAPVSHPPD